MRRPQGNAVVLAVLRSPAHRLLSGVAVELRYSGRQYVLPVQYATDGSRLVVAAQDPNSKTWWRNFRTPQPVTVRLAGRLREGTARVVDRADPAWEADRRLYGSRWRRSADRLDGPLVRIALGP